MTFLPFPLKELKHKIATITTSQIYTIPDDITEIDVYITGGGGAGSSLNSSNWGGNGAFAKLIRNLNTSSIKSLDVVIGLGGTAVAQTAGNDGGASSITFNGVTFSAGGGSGGTSAAPSKPNGNTGGGRSNSYHPNTSPGKSGGTGTFAANFSGNTPSATYGLYDMVNPYDGLAYCGGGGGLVEKLPISTDTLGPDGGGTNGGKGGIYGSPSGLDGGLGGGGGGAFIDSSGNTYRGGHGGIGGGGGGAGPSIPSGTAKAGNGGNGLCIIYGK